VSRSYPRHILAIDPGTEAAGWCRLEVPTPGTWSVRGMGAILLPAGQLYRRLAHLQEKLEPIIADAKTLFCECVVERPFVNKNFMATLAIAGARGVVLALMGRANLRFTEYSPQTWKQVIGNGRADKPEVAYKIGRILKLPSTPSFDQADAAAMALYHATRPDDDA